RRHSLEFGVQVPAMPVLLSYAVPARFDGHAISDFTRLQADQSRERDIRQRRISRPLHPFPVIDRPSNYRHVDWNLLRQFLVRIAGQADFRRAQLYTQIAALEINRPDLLEKKEINLRSRIFGPGNLREVLAQALVFCQRGISKGDARDLEPRALQV